MTHVMTQTFLCFRFHFCICMVFLECHRMFTGTKKTFPHFIFRILDSKISLLPDWKPAMSCEISLTLFSFLPLTECVAKAWLEARRRQHLLQARKLRSYLILGLHFPADCSIEWVFLWFLFWNLPANEACRQGFLLIAHVECKMNWKFSIHCDALNVHAKKRESLPPVWLHSVSHNPALWKLLWWIWNKKQTTAHFPFFKRVVFIFSVCIFYPKCCFYETQV